MHTSVRRCARIGSILMVAITTGVFADTSETWSGSNNNWSSAADWSPAAVPNNGTPAGTTYAVTVNAGNINLDINATIDSLALTGGTLNGNLGNSLAVLGATTINAATLQFGTSTAAGAHGSFASVDNFGSFTTGDFTGGNNTVSASGSFTNELNAVTFVLGAGDVANFNAFNNLGRFSVGLGATFNITGGGSGFTDISQNSTVQIAGDFNVINSNVPSPALGHLATIEGDLQLANHALSDASPITISTTGALELTGNQTFSTSSIANSGSVNLGDFAPGNNTLTVTGTFTNNHNAALRIVNTGDTVNVSTLVNQGFVQILTGETLNITGGGNGITDVLQGSTFSIAGSFNVINSNVPSSALTHLTTVEGDLQVANQTIADVSAIAISNTGALELTGNQTFSTSGISNSGSVNLGDFAPGNNTLTVSGTFTNNPGAALRIVNTGDTVNVNTLVNQGFVQILSGETLNITGGGNGITDVLQGSTLSIAGNFNVINAGPSSALAHVATIEGDVQLAGHALADASAITISNTGALELTGNQTFSTSSISNSGSVNLGDFAPGNNTLTVSGTFTNNPGAALRIVNTGDVVNVNALVNQGFVQILSGETLNITGGGNGITSIAAGSTIQLNGSINVINNNITTNGLASLATVAGVLELFNGQTLSVGNVSIASTGQLFLGNATTLIAGNITSSGFLASSSFSTVGNTLTITGTLTNNAAGTFNIIAGDTVTVSALNNSGTVNVGQNFTIPLLNGSNGIVSLGNVTLTLNGGSSQNTIRDNNAAGAAGTAATLISNGNVETGPLQLANVTINGHHTFALPGSKINTLTLQGSTGNWTSGLDLAPFAKTILEDSVTHNTTLARTLDQVNFGLTHADGIFSSALASNERLVVIDNATAPIPFATFGRQPADAGSILLMPTFLGDANLDGGVDLTDLSIVLNNFGSTTSSWLQGNFDGATTIDLTDLSDVLNNFGSSGGGGPNIAGNAPAPTPEPASLALFALGLAATLKRRRPA